MTFEETDIQSKLGMLLTADMTDPLQVRTMDIMLMKGRGYQAEDVENYAYHLSGMEDYAYRCAIGDLRDKYLPKELPPNAFYDITIMDGISTLSREQQISCAENIVDRLEWAEMMANNMYANEEPPKRVKDIMEKEKQVETACRSLLIKLGVSDATGE